MIIEILAWVTVIGIPIAAVVAMIYIYVRWLRAHPIVSQPYSHTPAPPSPPWWNEPTTTRTTTADDKVPEWTSIDEESFMSDEEEDVDCRKIVDPGTRVWRTYRSTDGIQWSECEPALTERAAYNYASYIKRSSPEEFVRCNDPNGVILFYE